ncbi:MAG: transglutaminase-like cysteine peptidase [Deltaproteobacteria bacterium]|jgi:predicted transglutaminase-like cysteine proteinase|nr:transglutaminase-like cysteine peptidase [Deltaproteobacteria bacterium]
MFLDQLWAAATQGAPARKPGQIVLPHRDSGHAPPVAPGISSPAPKEPAESDRPPSAADGAGAPVTPAAEPAGKEEWTRTEGAAARVNLFGTIEFRSKLKDAPQWERVVAEERKKSALDNPVGLAASWPATRDALKGQKRMDQLVAVNKFFNRFPYRTDMEAYGVLDYWATPAEFMKKSGDCEDFSIIKYYALKQLGVDPDSMRIVVVTDVIRNLAHAVLAVYLEGNAYILDNLSNLVLPHTRLTHYRPQFSVSENYRWVHMVPKKQ